MKSSSEPIKTRIFKVFNSAFHCRTFSNQTESRHYSLLIQDCTTASSVSPYNTKEGSWRFFRLRVLYLMIAHMIFIGFISRLNMVQTTTQDLSRNFARAAAIPPLSSSSFRANSFFFSLSSLASSSTAAATNASSSSSSSISQS